MKLAPPPPKFPHPPLPVPSAPATSVPPIPEASCPGCIGQLELLFKLPPQPPPETINGVSVEVATKVPPPPPFP